MLLCALGVLAIVVMFKDSKTFTFRLDHASRF